MKTHIAIITASLCLLSFASAEDPKGPVSRAEYNQAKAEFQAELKAQREQFEKELAKLKAQMQAREQMKPQAVVSGTGQKDLLTPILGTPVVASPGTRKLVLTGGASATYTSSGANNDFSALFNPIFLWEINDRLRFEGDVVFRASDGTSTEVETAKLSYDFCDYLTFGAGRFANPTNYFAMHLRKDWINKLPTTPRTLLVPMFEDGAELSGQAPLGSMLLTYAAFIGKSHLSRDFGTGDYFFSTALPFYSSNSAAINDIKTTVETGARIGFQPIQGLEIGYGIETFKAKGTVQADEFWDTQESFTDDWGYTYTTTVSHERHQRYALRVRPVLQSVDLNYSKDLNCIRGILDLHAQWAWSDVGSCGVPSKYGPLWAPFEMDRNSGYAQLAYRPVHLQGWTANLEPVVRYEYRSHPDDAKERWTFGLNYWLADQTVLKAAYQYLGDSHNDAGNDAWLLQFATGF